MTLLSSFPSTSAPVLGALATFSTAVLAPANSPVFSETSRSLAQLENTSGYYQPYLQMRDTYGQFLGEHLRRKDMAFKSLGKLVEQEGIGDSNSFLLDSIFDSARRFIQANVKLFSVINPKLSLTDDGAVNFWWKNGADRLDVDVYNDTLVVLYAELSLGARYREDSISIHSALFEQLARAFEHNAS